MKEITRIHIAKIPYNVEVAAKKSLESYMKSLEAYSDDKEIIADIEIRITEILAERGVKKGDVITDDDVTALKNQLGDPRDFMGDGDMAVGPEEDDRLNPEAVRKLYRDTDRAVLGGVLSGVAAFFKVNPALVRVLFIIVALASFGTALLVYIVLWIAVPPAKTAADKLQMAGRSITVGSIRELNENEVSRPVKADSNVRRVVTILVGIASVFGAAISAVVTASVTFAALFGGQHFVLEAGSGSRYVITAFILAVISGVLLTVLFILTAYASFVQKLTRRVVISLCIVIVAGLVSFASAIGVMQYAGLQRNYFIEANTRTTTIKLPDGSESIKALAASAPGLKVDYSVTTGKPYALLRAVAKDDSAMPKVTALVSNQTLNVSSEKSGDSTCITAVRWCESAQPTLEVHGPALDRLTAAKDTMIDYQPTVQASLAIATQENVSINILPGTIGMVRVDEGRDSVVSLTRATVNKVTAALKSSANLEAGTIESLEVNAQTTCPSHTREMRVSVWRVTSGHMMLNGAIQPAATSDSGCIEIDIESEKSND